MKALLSAVGRRGKALVDARYFASASELAVVDDAKRYIQNADPVPHETDFTSSLRYIQPTQVTTLPNGLRVATESIPFAQTTAVGVWIDAGSRYENDANNGAAHFLEHMAFKGTKSRTVKQLEVEIENMGGHLNAYTSREQTVYFAKVVKQDIAKAVDILSDILQNSNLDEGAIERERNVILREMQEVEGMPEEVVFDHLHSTAFQWSPLGRTILGSADNVKRMTRNDLSQYIATHYTAPRMVLVAAGAVNHDELVAKAEKAFAGLPTDPTTADDLVRQDPAKFVGSEVRIRNPDMDPCHFAIAFKGASWTDPDAIVLMVMQSMLGTWDKNSGAGVNMGSQLSQYAAANSLCDSYMAFNTNYKDSGLFGVYAVAPRMKLDDMSWAIMHEIARLCYEVNDYDVLRAKNQLKASLLLQQNSTQAVAEEVGRQMLTYGRRMPRAELFARIDKVDAKTIKAVADRFIYDQEVVISALGDCQFLPDYNYFRRRTYWLRY